MKLAALLLPVLAAARAATPIEIVTVFSYPKGDPYDRTNLYGFNHAPNVVTLPDGALLAAWFSGAYEGDVHQVILAARSGDGGRTWSEAAVLADTPRKSDFDAAFAVDGGTTWMIYAVGRWNRYPFVGLRDVEQREVGLDSYRVHLIRSDDSGRTWSAPVVPVDRRGFCRGNGLVLPDGRILFPVYDDSGGGQWTMSILRSADRGATWEWVGRVLAAEGKAGGEPVLTRLDDGSVLAALRSRDGKVWFAQSRDAGATWGAAFASEFDGAASSHALFRTRAGRVFLAFNECRPPHRTPLVLRELDQRAMRWGPPRAVAAAPPPARDEWSSQVSYPSMAETADGMLVVVWTEIAMAPARQTGKILAARLRP